ncbi:MAG: hypothetical protein HY013_03105 [Candidatus Solibacter usitatus]|nr:hypothetical protein [Candidatus Solibacter usitatus]
MIPSKIAVPVAILIAGFTIGSTLSYGKAEYTKKEKKACVTCHVSAKSKELNDTGRCYDKNKSLDGCKLPENK